MVKVISADDKEFDVPKEVAEKCDFLRACTDEDGGEDEIFVPKVKAHELSKIIKFCNLLLAEPMQKIHVPLRTNDLHDLVGADYYTFVHSIDVRHELVELILAVDFLGQDELMSLLCAHMAILAKTSENVDAFIGKFDASVLMTM